MSVTSAQTVTLNKSLLLLLGVCALMLALPTLSIWGAWFTWNDSGDGLISHLVATVLPDYVVTSLLLCLGVAFGVTVLGVASAVLVTFFDFPGRTTLSWLLLLPIAAPAYIVAFVYTDVLQYSGGLQVGLRALTGWEGALWPDIRSVGGAIMVFSVTLYPYVYILVRAALVERASSLFEAAALLGAGMPRRLATLAIPLARPALAAGVALVLMETLADYGVASYFGIQTFTTGIYKAWLVMDSPQVAAQLATILLLLVLAILTWEQRAQRRVRFASGRAQRPTQTRHAERVMGLQGVGLLLLGLIPVLLGFLLPALVLMGLFFASDTTPAYGDFFQWTQNSVRLGLITAALAVGIALTFGAVKRMRGSPFIGAIGQVISLGYAVPGAVVVIGILLPVVWLRTVGWGADWGYWVTGTSLGLIWAYLVRFTSVAMQTVDSGYTRLSYRLDETSQTLGIHGASMFRRVHMPLLRKSTYVAALLVLVDVLKELPVTLVLRPFDSDTLAVAAYQLARDERLDAAALPALALVLVGLVPVILLSRELKSSDR